jgi:hypothetical protein
MLKRKNEATMLLKTKGRAWVRFQNEPIFAGSEPKGAGDQDSGMAEGRDGAEAKRQRSSFKCAKY